jgi:hypothetical protein
MPIRAMPAPARPEASFMITAFPAGTRPPARLCSPVARSL